METGTDTNIKSLLSLSGQHRRGTEVVITALIRNQMVGVYRHVGSNPTLSATMFRKLWDISLGLRALI